MTTSPPPVSEPEPSALACPGDKVGPCAGCQRNTHKYGTGGLPLCQWCLAPAMQRWGPAVRFVSTRVQQQALHTPAE
ncbi:hypothetical protein [Streptomyces sp. BK79]|uniref:hypothetical protein n=1 Tax=Streptomyces sp. BK79 TaxID=3350097 RepID=UPI00377021B2